MNKASSNYKTSSSILMYAHWFKNYGKALEKIVKQGMFESYKNLRKGSNKQVQDAQKSPNKFSAKKSLLICTIIRLANIKEKERGKKQQT